LGEGKHPGGRPKKLTRRVGRPKSIASEARKKLKPEQIAFAEWLAIPKDERVPKLQKEFAEQIGVADITVKLWKHIPEIWMVRDEVMDAAGRELVPEALAALKRVLKSDSSQAIKAASDILSRYAEPVRKSPIIATLKNLWDAYHHN